MFFLDADAKSKIGDYVTMRFVAQVLGANWRVSGVAVGESVYDGPGIDADT
jgi:hypothetical protein